MALKPLFEPTRPIHWVVDWDGTITQRDTLDSLVSIAASAKPDSPVLQEWQRVSEAYMLDYNNAIKKLAPNGELPETVQDEKKLLLALASVEQASLDRVSASGIFAGLTRQLIEDAAKRLIDSKKVELRRGVAPFLHSVQSRPHEGMNILSVNWSRHFIGACLRAAEALLDRTSIYANELDGIEGGAVSHGYISPKNDAKMLIISSGDKLKYLNRLRNRHEESTNGLPVSSAPIVYVGDSWTDIECLLEADLGICIRDEPMGSSQKKLAERLEGLGVRCPHLSDWKEADEHQVVWASDFLEIQEWVGKHGTKSAE